MLAKRDTFDIRHVPTAGVVKGATHSFECAECEGTGRATLYRCCGGQGCSACERQCIECDGTGSITAEVDPEDCHCDACVDGFWFWPEPRDRDDEPTPIRFSTREAAIGAGPGEVTQRAGYRGNDGHRAIKVRVVSYEVIR